MEKRKKIAIFYYLTAVICYVCAVMWFCGSRAGLGAMWLCIGSANLCLGSVWMKRSRKPDDQERADLDSQSE